MVFSHSLWFTILAQYCSCIAKIANCANSLVVFLCSYKCHTASCSNILSLFGSQLLIDYWANFYHDLVSITLFFVVFYFVVFLLKNLNLTKKGTRGIASTQYSDTLAPPCPSRIAKRPLFMSGKLSWEIKSWLRVNYCPPCTAWWENFCFRSRSTLWQSGPPWCASVRYECS